ncbi:TPA: BppU family phage baseplate upper protein [Enterococcus faecium]|uniref:BppU family phage baseplate upper protein n=1 Tax=Enterococcus faecium TaxID=1352 RepID=UPI002989359F|nr:BppU family phage baseplate upper protein [Enterococcus faecium]HAZ1081078.1 BppU family phage baseplate upper protein [Enterococcus faecium]HCQ8784385.1 BppU family phage baseplate upper protein [Enterococcus faecium]HCZ8405663.1 BppU family phage baseplate upper protein [Enterococcus faecium]
MVYKMNESIIVIQAEATSPNRTNVVFWSHDRGTAKLRMKLVRKNGIPQSLPEGTTVPIRLMFKSATAEGGYGKHDYLATIEDPVNGIVSIVLEDNILGYVGTVEGSVYIDFPNDRSLDTAGRFTFYIKRSPIDDSTPELEDYYFNGFSQTIDKIEKILADGKQEIEQKITESETQIDAKLKDTSNKITKANQDVATINTNIDKANDRIDQTNQQIGDLGKLKKMYSNSIDFGGYDYSGRANLAPNLDFSKFSSNGTTITKPLACFKDHETYLELDSSDPSAVNINRNIYVPNCSALLPNNVYIMTVPIMINADFDIFRTALILKASDGTALGTINPPRENVGTWQNVTTVFTVPSNLKFDTTYLQLWQPMEGNGKIYIGYDIKIEKVNSTSDTATPYQPNLLEAPYYLSKVALGEDIANKSVKFPINSSNYPLYVADMSEPYIAGKTYTVTIKATKPSAQTFRVYSESTTDYYFGDLKPVEGLVDVWSLTFTTTKVSSKYPKLLQILQYPAATVGACKIDWLKIEKGNTRTPNISQFKYFGEGLKDSNNPNDYSWDVTPEYTEKGLNNTVSLTEPQSVEGLKNFEDGLQLKGVSVVQDNFTSKAVTTKNITDFTEDSIVRFERWGRLVIANIEITNKSANFAGWKNLMAFPLGYTPISLVGWGGTLSNKTNRNPALSVYANSSGISVMISSADLPANQRCSGTVAYFTNDEWPQG